MKELIFALVLIFQFSTEATSRNFDIVDSPRYQYMKGKKNSSSKKSFSKPKYSSSTYKKYYKKSYILTLDTRDSKVCETYAQTLESEGALNRRDATDLCKVDIKNPYISVAVEPPQSEYGRGVRYSDLSPREQELARQTQNFIVPAVGMMAILFALPKSATGWDSFEGKGLGKKWKSNVKAGPVKDHDKWAVNYIGHPYAGAAYYVIARHAGFDQAESFMYSAFMSTFFWEYGIEAFAEVPSIQDLILTPVLGALLGELFMMGTKKVKENNGQVLGSQALGSVSLFLMNPAGGILNASDRLFEYTPFSDAEFQLQAVPEYGQAIPRVGFNMVFWLTKK